MRKSIFMWAFLFVLVFCFSGMAFADLTVTDKGYSVWGNKKARTATIAFDSSYAWGGESLTKASLGIDKDEQLIILGQGGYSFEYDYTNEKIKVFSKAPPIVYEEKKAATATAGITLDYPAAFIFNVVDSSGNNCQWMYNGTTTLSTNSYATSAEFADGERTGVTVDAADTYYITYATQSWKDLYDLLVQNEVVTFPAGASGASAATTASGNTIFAFGVARAGATTFTPIDVQDTPTSTEIGIDFGGSGTTASYLNIPYHSVAETVEITYLKRPATGTWLADRFVESAYFNAAAGADDGVSTVTVPALKGPILTWNTSGFAFSSGDDSLKLVRPSDATATAGKIKWNYQNPTMTISASANMTFPVYGTDFGDTSNGVTLTGNAFTWGYPWEIPNLVNIEVPNGRDLSDLTGIKIIMIGR